MTPLERHAHAENAEEETTNDFSRWNQPEIDFDLCQ